LILIMQIETLGSLGLGFVWGWLLGMYSRSVEGRRLGNWVVLLLATSLLVLLTQRFLEWQEVGVLLIAAGCSAAAHLAWLHSLRQRNYPTDQIRR
jgi:hypothetical protein